MKDLCEKFAENSQSPRRRPEWEIEENSWVPPAYKIGPGVNEIEDALIEYIDEKKKGESDGGRE